MTNELYLSNREAQKPEQIFNGQMLKKIDHVNVVISNLDIAKEFFTQLGFKVGDESELTGEWISLIVGLQDVKAKYVTLSLPGSSTKLELIEYVSPPSDQDNHIGKANMIGIRHIAFEVDDIEELVQGLKDKGVKFVNSIQTYPKTGKRLIYLYGPDEILLELAQYHE